MKKLDSLVSTLEQYITDKSKFFVFTDGGSVHKSQPKLLHFKQKYRAIIQINDYAGDPTLLNAVVADWVSENEHRTASDNSFEFDVALERSTEAFVQITIDLEENVTVKKDENGVITVNEC